MKKTIIIFLFTISISLIVKESLTPFEDSDSITRFMNEDVLIEYQKTLPGIDFNKPYKNYITH